MVYTDYDLEKNMIKKLNSNKIFFDPTLLVSKSKKIIKKDRSYNFYDQSKLEKALNDISLGSSIKLSAQSNQINYNYLKKLWSWRFKQIPIRKERKKIDEITDFTCDQLQEMFDDSKKPDM